MKLCLAGEGAIGRTHLDCLAKIDGIEIASIAGGVAAATEALTHERNIPHWSLDLAECLNQPGVEAVILATPSQLHAAQAALAISLGKHVLVEIPMALSIHDSLYLATLERSSGLVCMVAHSRRFAPPHREIYRRIQAGEFHLQHFVIETYFLRRSNMNARGEARSWTDNLLWHHGCHGVDLARWMIADDEMDVCGQVGPLSPALGIPMDMSILLRSSKGPIVTMALSFNNHGPFGGFHRYIGEEGTFLATRDTLFDAERNPIPLEGQSILDQDRAFIAAIREGKPPLTSFGACVGTMQLLDRIETCLSG